MRKQIVNSYSYFFKHDCDIIWYKFKNEYVYNENRLEGSKLEQTEVAEIVTDLRLHKQESYYCNTELQDVIETAGQSSLYDFIFEEQSGISAFSLLKLHGMLYQYAPYPEAAGNGRVSRIFLNWLFRLKSLPPVYLKYESKELYYKALQTADLQSDFTLLNEVFYNEVIVSMIELYDGRRLMSDEE